MNKYLVIAVVLTIVAIIFVSYALTHPTLAFNIDIHMLYVIYAFYIVVAIVMYIIGVFKLKNR